MLFRKIPVRRVTSDAGILSILKSILSGLGGIFSMAISNMKLGEKLLFGGFALIGVMAFVSWLVLEVVRSRSG